TGILTADLAWVVRPQGSLLPVDIKKYQPGEPIIGLKQPCGGLVSAFSSLWVPTCGDSALVRIDATTRKITATIASGTGPAAVALASTADSVWMLTDNKTTLSRIDPDDNRIVSELRLPSSCTHILSAENSLWVTCGSENRILRVDPRTNLVADRIEVAAG